MPIGCKIRVKIDEIKLILKTAVSGPLAPAQAQPDPAQMAAVMAKLEGLSREIKAVREHQVKREDKLIDRLLARLEEPYAKG